MTGTKDSEFAIKICELIRQVPRGRVVSYSQVATMCDKPGAARVVGQIAHFGSPDLPWHRLIMADGSMARGYVPGGPEYQAKILISEGVEIVNSKVRMDRYQWR